MKSWNRKRKFYDVFHYPRTDRLHSWRNLSNYLFRMHSESFQVLLVLLLSFVRVSSMCPLSNFSDFSSSALPLSLVLFEESFCCKNYSTSIDPSSSDPAKPSNPCRFSRCGPSDPGYRNTANTAPPPELSSPTGFDRARCLQMGKFGNFPRHHSKLCVAPCSVLQ